MSVKVFVSYFFLGDQVTESLNTSVVERERECVCVRERAFVSECAFVKSKVGTQDV